MGIKHADRIDASAARRAARPRRPRRLLRREPAGAVLRQEPRARPGRRARRDHPHRRLRQERRRPAALPLRPAQQRRRRAAAERRRHPRPQAHDVVSSFSAADMDPERTKPRRRPAAALPRLRRVARREARPRRPPRRPSSTRSSSTSATRSSSAGIPLVCQHGVSGYRIDFAAKHPEQPGRLVLAIEADGASYHSSHTARDRDRLRQEQLERLGWRFHRIWSQDWFTDRAARDRQGRRRLPRPPSARRRRHRRRRRPPAAGKADRSHAPAPQRGPRPDRAPVGTDRRVHRPRLQAIVRWIEADTLLRSREDLSPRRWRSSASAARQEDRRAHRRRGRRRSKRPGFL